ncbi:MAG: hypothetical protein OXC26_19165 [Albidovulum sp.]|nr:hypothetical protein [Albidovulum sp.]
MQKDSPANQLERMAIVFAVSLKTAKIFWESKLEEFAHRINGEILPNSCCGLVREFP